MGRKTAIEERQEQFVEEFTNLGDWMTQMEYLVEAAGEMKPMPDEMKTEQTLVPGCQSRSWLVTKPADDGRLRIWLDSDAVIVKGILAIILYLTDGETPEDIQAAEFNFFDRTMLKDEMTSERAFGIASIIHRIQEQAGEWAKV